MDHRRWEPDSFIASAQFTGIFELKLTPFFTNEPGCSLQWPEYMNCRNISVEISISD